MNHLNKEERQASRDSQRDGRDGDERSSRGGGFARRRPRPPADLRFDYKDVELLKQFISEGGRIVPARVSRLNRKQQRELTQEVKRARQLALLPIADSHSKG